PAGKIYLAETPWLNISATLIRERLEKGESCDDLLPENVLNYIMPVPLLPIDLLRIPLFSLSIGTSICSFCAQMLAMVSLPFYLQT
ncbi:hypothetical protein MJM45_31305, partial [Salmonella enterica subsp. enterica serovar Kentucky]|nr:hypothetical protein [Salmonella enterica subsp. enterica serovar Kentucky]